MLTPSIIYAAVTVILALIDALRIKKHWGKIANIDHKVSDDLAIIIGATVILWWLFTSLLCNWWSLLAIAIAGIGMVFIRIALFDICLNIFRILTKTNPTGKIDYVSLTTSSYVDQHSEKANFWLKRIIGAAGWVIMYFLYRLIFKV